MDTSWRAAGGWWMKRSPVHKAGANRHSRTSNTTYSSNLLSTSSSYSLAALQCHRKLCIGYKIQKTKKDVELSLTTTVIGARR